MPRLGELDAAKYLFGYGGLFYCTRFDSFDGFFRVLQGTGTITYAINGVVFQTGSVANQYLVLGKRPDPTLCLNTPSWAKRRRFKTKLSFDDVDMVTQNIGVDTITTGNFFGFRFTNGQLYGFCERDTVVALTSSLRTVTYGDCVALEAVFMPEKRVDFYVDKAYKGSLTTCLPHGADTDNYLLYIKVQTLENALKMLRVTEWFYLQEP